jgi:hypothetical protein
MSKPTRATHTLVRYLRSSGARMAGWIHSNSLGRAGLKLAAARARHGVSHLPTTQGGSSCNPTKISRPSMLGSLSCLASLRLTHPLHPPALLFAEILTRPRVRRPPRSLSPAPGAAPAAQPPLPPCSTPCPSCDCWDVQTRGGSSSKPQL